jgi:hypothetical protein
MKKAVTLLACFLSAACSNSDPVAEAKVTSGSEVAGKDACEIMTLADVQDVYSQTMKKSGNDRATQGPSADLSTCTYQSEDVRQVATMMVTWSKSDSIPLASRDAYALSAEKDIPEDLRKELAVEKVEFQGLPALWQAGQLKVFKNRVMLSVLADAAAGKDAKQTMEALMVKALGHV